MFKSRKKEKAELLDSYHKIKSVTFYFESIGRYFRREQADVYQTISDRTYQDLDLDEVFMYLDRTVSKVGQQYFYHLLRTIPDDSKRADSLEKLVNSLDENPEIKEKVICQLFRLNKDEAYYIADLFQEEYIQKPSWFWITQLLSIASIVLVLLSFFYPQLLLVLLLLLSANYLVHYWNKKNIYRYGNSITQLLVLTEVTKDILKPGVIPASDDISAAANAIDQVGRKVSMFKLEARFESDFDGLVEMVKALFLVEPLMLFSGLAKLNTKREHIHQLYRFIGEVDVAISMSTIRKNAPYCTKPRISEQQKHIVAEDLYHPLLVDFVANTIELSGKSALLTGSNMSGKTTFIRTLGINVILSQTINICFARSFVIPKLKVHSAIRIADDLMSEKSYYFEEVLTLKGFLEESTSDMPTLFLLDEIYKGTNTVERIAAGKSVLSYLNRNDNMVLVSTHDLELADLLEDTYDLYHFTELVENENIVFDYKLRTGNLKSTNAIRILEINDYPPEVINEAQLLSRQIGISNVTNKA